MTSLIPTNAGRAFATAAMYGENISITRMAIGSGAAPEDPEVLTELVDEEVSIPLTAYQLNGNVLTITGTFNNSSVSDAFHWTETGVYAEDADGNEVLIAYGNAGGDYETVPKSSDAAYETQLSVVLTIDGAQNISVTLSSAIYVTQAEFDAHKHSAADITSGTLPLTRGGTGVGTIDALRELIMPTVTGSFAHLSTLESKVDSCDVAIRQVGLVVYANISIRYTEAVDPVLLGQISGVSTNMGTTATDGCGSVFTGTGQNIVTHPAVVIVSNGGVFSAKACDESITAITGVSASLTWLALPEEDD